MEIFINGNLAQKFKEFENQGSFTIGEYRTPKILKTSSIRFEIWDENAHFEKKLMLNQTRSIRQLTEHPNPTIYAEIFEGNRDNVISLSNSEWQDDFNDL